MNKLNAAGVAHVFAMAAVVVGVVGSCAVVPSRAYALGNSNRSALSLTTGARKDGVQLPFIPQLVAQVGDTLEFGVTVTNPGATDVKNVVVSTNGIRPTGLGQIPGSLAIDGQRTTTALITKTVIGTLPAHATRVVTFKATVGATSYSRCGNHKYKVTTAVRASGTPTQLKTIQMEVCPTSLLPVQAAKKSAPKPTLKPRQSVTLVTGARKDGVNLPFIPQLVAQVGDTLEFGVTLTNPGAADLKNVVVSTSGIRPSGLSQVNGSLLVDGKNISNSTISNTVLGILPAHATRVVTFKATVGATSYSRCGDHKYKVTTAVRASGTLTQVKTIQMEVCSKA